MNSTALIERLAAGAAVIDKLTAGISPEQARWKQAPDKWSLLEVTVHLLDEEREDFRVRLGLVLKDPELEWPGIDPGGWVTRRDYAARDLEETRRQFFAERDDSLNWLRQLSRPHWGMAKVHPVAGSLSAGDLLAAWVVHDLMHIRQLNALHYGWVCHLAAPHTADYAGDW